VDSAVNSKITIFAPAEPTEGSAIPKPSEKEMEREMEYDTGNESERGAANVLDSRANEMGKSLGDELSSESKPIA
jgi:hypothetical protein